jgi:hypothetical protein
MAGFDTSRLCWPLEQWPEVDQAAWAVGLVPGDPFDDPHYGPHLRSGSCGKIRKGYGRWLSFLAERGWLDLTSRRSRGSPGHACAPTSGPCARRATRTGRSSAASGSSPWP